MSNSPDDFMYAVTGAPSSLRQTFTANIPPGTDAASASGVVAAMVLPIGPEGEEKGAEEVVELTAQQIIASAKRGSILREFPSQFLDKTLAQIKQAKQEGVPFAQKALKLLTDSRFNK